MTGDLLTMIILLKGLLWRWLVDVRLIPLHLAVPIRKCVRNGKMTLVVHANPNKEGIGKHDKGDMTIPSHPASHLILIQPKGFARLQIFLHMPPFANRSNDLLQCGERWGEHQIIGQGVCIIDTATNEE